MESARYPTTITNLSIPAAWEESRMCSRSGAPKRETRGLGALPDREAMRLPLPAARIRHSLTVAIDHLDPLKLKVFIGWHFLRWTEECPRKRLAPARHSRNSRCSHSLIRRFA